jgi:hypothetical protein
MTERSELLLRLKYLVRRSPRRREVFYKDFRNRREAALFRAAVQSVVERRGRPRPGISKACSPRARCPAIDPACPVVAA